MKPTCSIMVLNYNGKHLLEQFLESVVGEAERARICSTDVVLVDNQSTDGSRNWVRDHWSQVRLLVAPSNRYLYSLNWAAQRIDSELVLLLNNDIGMSRACLDPLFDVLLSESRVFSVTPKLLGMDRIIPNGGCFTGRFCRGMLRISLVEHVEEIAPTLFGCGGALLVRRKDLLALGGFDELYFPAYWEDVDLCYRAWKQGLASLCQPESLMYHVHSASFSVAPGFQKPAVSYRNCWLLTWRNVSDAHILASNLYWTARYCLSAFRRRDGKVLAMHRQALSRWQHALRCRLQDERFRTISDAEIVQQVSDRVALSKDVR